MNSLSASSSNDKAQSMKYKINSLLQDRDAQIVALSSELKKIKSQLEYATAQLQHQQQQQQQEQQQYLKTNKDHNHHDMEKKRKKKKALVTYGAVVHVQEAECDPKKGGRRSLRGRPNLSLKRTFLGRNASICTTQALLIRTAAKTSSAASTTGSASPNISKVLLEEEDFAWIPSHRGREQVQQIMERILTMFKDPSDNMKYLQSTTFASDILKLNHHMKKLLIKEPRVIFLQSPCYVFGDIHGNLEDLHFFSDNLWRLGMALTAGNFVFLGDYVDRGKNCLEVIAYLHAMKLLLPHKVTLLRGNHETRDVNGWEEHYGPRSFLSQCNQRFGEQLGYTVWESTNQVFDRMPLAAVIDQDIFCVHGGIPRPLHTVHRNDEDDVNDGLNTTTTSTISISSRIQDILRVPNVSGINPPYEHEPCLLQRVASDCIWSDPASSEQERTCVDPQTGFGESLRGGGAICFGHKAVTDFLEQEGYSYIMRAHEAHAQGVAVSKGARVFTVFSTSKDHNQGDGAMAGCMLVDHDKLQVINRSPAYKNQYIHRRDSISLQALSEKEIHQRIQLGLVTLSEEEEDNDYNPNEEDDEQWESIVEEDENYDDGEEDGTMEYILDTRRASMVETWNTAPSPERHAQEEHVYDDQEETIFPQKLSSLQEGEEEDEEEDSTVDGEAELAMQAKNNSNNISRSNAWNFTMTTNVDGSHQHI